MNTKTIPKIHPQTILLVDDDDIVLDILAETLAADGHVVLKAHDGMAALAILARSGANIDLVVTDIFMPEMEGIELIQAIRRISPTCLIVAMSGGGSRERFAGQYLAMARRLGANEIIYKPINPEEFAALVASVILTAQTPPENIAT